MTEDDKPFIVAIDGPAGSGKSSVSMRVGREFGFVYVNTGSIYRSVALCAKRLDTNLDNPEDVTRLIDYFCKSFEWDCEGFQPLLESKAIAKELYSDDVAALASKVAKLGVVRDCLLPLQRSVALGAKNGAILDGRDIGTVVFPDANLKVFLTADLQERAKRRAMQSDSESFEEILHSMKKRDEQDSLRKKAPLRSADDAIIIDTSNLAINGVVEKIVGLIKDRRS